MSILTASHGLTLSERGLKLIKAFEGYRPVDRTLVNGQRVVGYGHKLYDENPHKLSKNQAEKLLKSDLQPYEDMINENIHAPLTQGQFDALVSFSFNIGPRAFLVSDTVHALNNGRYLDAANSLDVWRKSTINGKTYVIDALMRRRTAEKALFLRTDKQPQPAPTIDLPPKRDGIVSSVVDDTPVLPEDFDATPGPLEGDKTEQAYRLESAKVGIVEQAPIEASEQNDAALSLAEEETPWVEEEPPAEVATGDFAESLEAQAATQFQNEDTILNEAILEDTSDGLDAPIVSPDVEVVEIAVETPVETTEVSEIHVLDEILELNELDEISAEDLPVLESVAEFEAERPLSELGDDPIEAPRSVIAEAAADISDRLDALIENVRDGDEPSAEDWPETLIQPQTPAEPVEVEVEEIYEVETPQVAQTLRSNEEAVLTAPADLTAEVIKDEIDARPADLIIDNLAEDDAMRLHGDSPDPFASREMPQAVEKPSSSIGLWAIMVLGLVTLFLAFAVNYQGAERLLGEWGPLIVLAGALIGGLMLLGGFYYLVRRAFR